MKIVTQFKEANPKLYGIVTPDNVQQVLAEMPVKVFKFRESSSFMFTGKVRFKSWAGVYIGRFRILV
jgi:hypothetical protein